VLYQNLGEVESGVAPAQKSHPFILEYARSPPGACHFVALNHLKYEDFSLITGTLLAEP
jgi:hypothetical protein